MTARGARGTIVAILAAAAVAVAAPPAWAQNDSSVVLGVAVSTYYPSNPNVHDPVGIGLIGRLRRPSGIGATVGLDWFDAEVRSDVGGQQVQLGDVRLRPLMVGVSYTRQYAKFALSASVVGGWSFNSMRGSDAAAAAYRDRFGAPDASFHASNCLAWRPDASLWFELGNHFGAMVSLSYMGVRPTIVTSSRLGRREERVDVGAPMLTFAIAYGVF